jgi:2-aminoethylphosphonate dioxygenase
VGRVTGGNMDCSSAILDREQIAHFQRYGWVVARHFLPDAHANLLQYWTHELSMLPEQPGQHMVYFEDSLLDSSVRVVQRIEYFCKAHPAFGEFLNRGILSETASALLGEPALLFKEKINFKYPGGSGFKAHQDQQAGWSVYAPVFVSALVAIDDATVENGCLEIGITRGKRLCGLIGAEWAPLGEDDLQYESVPTAPGDVVFFDSYVPHRSRPNLTGSPRRILYATYNGCSHGDHREHYFCTKRANFPPDCERKQGEVYTFRV